MESVCGTDYTSAELRSWLQKLGMPSTGMKSAMLLRLNEVPPDKRGECPAEAPEQQEKMIENCSENYRIICVEENRKQNECNQDNDEHDKLSTNNRVDNDEHDKLPTNDRVESSEHEMYRRK